MRTALFWARYGGKPIVLASDLDFCQRLWSGYHAEALKHGHDIQPGDEAAWGGAMICHTNTSTAQEWLTDPMWMWDTWFTPFGRDIPNSWLAILILFLAVLKKRAGSFQSRNVFSSSSKGFMSANRCSVRLICSPTRSCHALPIKLKNPGFIIPACLLSLGKGRAEGDRRP